MIRGFYSAASGMLVQFLRQQVLSTNLANVNTVGYKQARLVSKASAEVAIPGAAPSDFGATFADLLGADSPAPVGNVGGGALAEPVATDWSEGMIRVTHEDTDLALTGPGFFRVQAPNGQTLYTRAGNFGRQTDGSLVTADGNRVMGQNGPIALPAQGKLEVKPDGSVYVEGHFLDRLAIDDLPPDAGLQPVGQNSFQVTNPNATILASTDTTVGQGQLESSNVDLPQAMVDMMSAMRTYEASQKILQMEDQTVQRAVNDVGRLA
jgi:flagellar basal-body rod protein FlgG